MAAGYLGNGLAWATVGAGVGAVRDTIGSIRPLLQAIHMLCRVRRRRRRGRLLGSPHGRTVEKEARHVRHHQDTDAVDDGGIRRGRGAVRGRGEREDSGRHGFCLRSAGVARGSAPTPLSRRAGGARAARARRPEGATNPLQRTGVARRSTSSIRQSRGNGDPAADSAGVQRDRVKTAELTRPCSPQESRARVDDPAPRRCRSPVATVRHGNRGGADPEGTAPFRCSAQSTCHPPVRDLRACARRSSPSEDLQAPDDEEAARETRRRSIESLAQCREPGQALPAQVCTRCRPTAARMQHSSGVLRRPGPHRPR